MDSVDKNKPLADAQCKTGEVTALKERHQDY